MIEHKLQRLISRWIIILALSHINNILYGVFLGMEPDEPADSCLASFEWTCPKACKCADGIADCRQKKLTTIPKHFPEDTTEM